MINSRLAIERNLSFETIAKIERLHCIRDGWKNILQLIVVTNKDVKNPLIKEIVKNLEDVEYRLQGLWGFEKTLKYYHFWDLPGCECPVLDNKDRLGTNTFVKNSSCPLHGES